MVALALVMGGAVGNFVDRMRYNYVVDFIDFRVGHRFKWPTFNVADMAITVGVILLFAEMSSWLRLGRRRRAGHRPPRSPSPKTSRRVSPCSPTLFSFDCRLLGKIAFPAYFTLLTLGFACALLLTGATPGGWTSSQTRSSTSTSTW